MYKKEDNIFEKFDDNTYIMKVQYKDMWYNIYIDSDDLEKVQLRHWRTSHKKQKVYIVSGSATKNNVVYLHNYIMNYTYTTGYEVDHQDGNSLNNRKSNLKIVSRQENISSTQVRIDNKIGIRGVSKNPWNSYKVDFSHNKIRYYFQNWKTIEEAVYCRKFAEEYFGLTMLNRNPLAQQYLTLTEEQQIPIKEAVLKSIAKATV